MKVVSAVAVIALLATPAWAQSLGQGQHIQKYGESAKDKSPTEIEADRAAERAYQNSLGNIPDQGPADPWGTVRSEGAPKNAAKAAPAKKTKTGSTAN